MDRTSFASHRTEGDWPHIQQIIEERYDAKPADGILSEMAHAHFKTGGKRLRALIPAAIFGYSMSLWSRWCTFLRRLKFSTIRPSSTMTCKTRMRLAGSSQPSGKNTVRPRQSTAEMPISSTPWLFWPRWMLSPQNLVELMRIFSHSSLRSFETSREFVEKERLGEASLESYLSIVEGKTGGLLALPLRGAVLLSLGDLRYDKMLESIGLLLGTVFQIQDDLLDIVGKKGREIEAADLAEESPAFWRSMHCKTAPPSIGVACWKFSQPREPRLHPKTFRRASRSWSGSIATGFAEIERLETLLSEQTQGNSGAGVAALSSRTDARFLQPIAEARASQV